MADDVSIFPFEVLVAGTPASHQAKGSSKPRWMTTVADIARARVKDMVEFTWLDQRPLALSVFFFTPDPMEGDIDNIIKPIMDSLVGVAYLDDRAIERVLAQKFELGVDWTFAQPSEVLAAALDVTEPVVYIRIDDDCAWRRN